MRSSFFILVVLVFSCTVPLDISDEQFNSRIVVGGAVSNDRSPVILLSSEKAILDNLSEKDYLSGANVTLTSNNQEVASLVERRNAIDSTLTDAGSYVALNFDSTIMALGSTYELRISKDGYSDVNAVVTIPDVKPIFEVDTSYLSKVGPSLFLNMIITIPRNQPIEFFQLYPIFRFGPYSIFEGTNGIDLVDSSGREQTYLLPRADNIKLEDHLLDDFVFDENKIPENRKVSIQLLLPTLREEEREPAPELILELRNLSEDYFRYIDTSLLQELQAGDPFSQPVDIFSNVEGGLGIVGSYSMSEIALRIELN